MKDTPWNSAYAREAKEIAALILEADGYRWTADQVRRAKQPNRQEVRVAMLALMVARGEYKLRRPI